MALSFKERNQIRKQIGAKLSELEAGTLSFKEKNAVRREIGELLKQLDEKLDTGAGDENQKLKDLISGKFDDETPIRFLSILKEIVDEIKDVEPVKPPTIRYIEKRIEGL